MPASALNALARGCKKDAPGLGSKIPTSGAANASRDARNFIRRWGLTWKVPLSHIEFVHNGITKDTPYLSPLKYIPFLLERAPELLFGGLDAVQGQKLLSSFWGAYRQTHPEHHVFKEHADSLSTVLPLTVHGDEGRGVRKGNTCLLSVETPFGLGAAINIETGFHHDDCKCCKHGELNLHAACTGNEFSQERGLTAFMDLNTKGHCFLNKMLVFLLPHALYKDSQLLEQLLARICQELRQLFFEGVYARGRWWHAALIGWKGDLMWYAKTANLNRCYNRLAFDALMCHECEAGSLSEPFEDVNEIPCWRNSIYKNRPWETSPVFSCIPFEDKAPEKVLRRDPFHNTKLGVFRDFIASSILLLAEMKYFHDEGGRNSRNHLLNRAYMRFKLYTMAVHRPAALRSFTTDNFNAPKRRSYPWMSCKGSDATLLVEWLVVMTAACLMNPLELGHVATLEKLNQASRSANAWTKAMYRHGIFMRKSCARAIYKEGRRFVELYNELAYDCLHKLNFCGFALKPKLHLVAHGLFEQKTWLDDPIVTWVPNPYIWNCEGNEDCVGRVSRLARRVHQTQVCRNCIERFLMKSKFLYKRYKEGRSRKRKR